MLGMKKERKKNQNTKTQLPREVTDRQLHTSAVPSVLMSRRHWTETLSEGNR